MIDIGNSLRKYRNSHCFTQQYVANLLDITRVTYRKWENNEVDFSLSQLVKIAELYEIPIQDIIIQSDFRQSKIASLKQKSISIIDAF